MLFSLAGATHAFARIEVNVTQVGFPTLRSGHVVRHGSWSALIVDLALVGEASFDGTIRVAQFDNDGDRCFDEVDVHLRTESGGTQRVYLYALINQTRGPALPGVELFDDDGEAVEVLSQGVITGRAEPPESPTIIADDDLLILSISRGTIGRLRGLVDADGAAPNFERDLHVAHISPGDLPPHWIGLEAADCIVWDDARPDDLTDRQLAALLAWVRQGGTLLLAASRSAAALAMTDPLRTVLPVEVGDVVAVDDLDVRYTLVGPVKQDEDPTGGFLKPVAVAQVTLRPRAQRVPNHRGERSDVVTRRRLGRGWIVFSAVTLRDLFSAPGNAVDFFQDVFHLKEVDESEQSPPTPVSLFGSIVSRVSFSRSASLYLLIVGIASIGYVLLATFGSWGFLRVRRWTHHSWSVFALLGISASALTVGAVQSMRGFGERLHQLSVIDADAGQTYGDATVLFGLRSGSDKRLDVWLPSDPLRATEPGETECFLRPMPGPSDIAARGGSFTDPGEYRLIPASAVVDDVRLRATLKLFEGRWNGPLGGKLTGRVRVRGKRITDDSHVINELGVDLHDCILLQPTAEKRRTVRGGDVDILCYAIGDIPSDGSIVNLADRCYGQADEESLDKLIADATLRRKQSEWNNGFRSIIARAGLGTGGEWTGSAGLEYGALLLLSTIGEFDPATLGGRAELWMGRHTWSRDRLRWIDLGEQLEPGSVILIGVADDPGPVRLFRREGDRPYRVLQPDAAKSRTVYRIRIPVGMPTAGREQSAPLSEKQQTTEPVR